MKLNLGRFNEDTSAGFLVLEDDMASATVSGVDYSGSASRGAGGGDIDAVDIIRRDGEISQIRVADGLVVVNRDADSTLIIEFFADGDVEGKTDWTWDLKPGATPVGTWKIAPAGGDGTERSVEITRGSDVTTYNISEGSEGVEKLLAGTILEKEWQVTNQGERKEYHEIWDPDPDILRYRAVTNYYDFSTVHADWGEEVVEVTIGEGAQARTTKYNHKQSGYGADGQRKGNFPLLQSVEYPDGSWEYFEYDSERRKSKEFQPFGDVTLANRTANNSEAIEYRSGSGRSPMAMATGR